MKKLFIAMIVCFTVLLTAGVACASVVASGTCGDSATWELDDQGVLTIGGSGAMQDYGSWESQAPWYSHKSSIKSVNIQCGITQIGSYAFSYCRNLLSITISSSVTNIGDQAFWDCGCLTNIYVDNLEQWLKYNHLSSRLYPQKENGKLYINYEEVTSITIPSSVKSIGNQTFFNCSNLTSIIIPSTVIIIGQSAFSGCSNLMSITVESGNQVYRSEDNCLIKENELILGCTNSVIPSSVTSIGKYAFMGCSNLLSITIPSSVTNIGHSAFWDCSSLSSITFPSSVTSIGHHAFYNCRSLTSITIPSSVTSIGHSAFSDCVKLTSIYVDNLEQWLKYDHSTSCIYPQIEKGKGILYINNEEAKSITVPSSVTSIGDYAFRGCSSLVNIIIPSTVTSIGNYAFYSCGNLTSITIPLSVTSIGEATFDGCSSLKSITIPSSVTSIGHYALFGCNSLTSITIPSSVTRIGQSAFSCCSNLTSITIPSSVTSIGYAALPMQTTVYCFESSYAETYAKENGNPIVLIPKHNHDIVLAIDESIESTCSQAGLSEGCHCAVCGEILVAQSPLPLLDHTTVTDPAISASAKTYGLTEGSHCDRCYQVLKAPELIPPNNGATSASFVLPTSLNIIKTEAFKNTMISVIRIPSTCTAIGSRAFADCANLVWIEIPASVTTIAADAFSGSTKVMIVTTAGSAAQTFAEAQHIRYMIGK